MSWCPQMHINFTSPLLGIKAFMSHFQSFLQTNLSVKIFLLLEDPIKESWWGGGGGGRGAELNIYKSKIKYQAATLLSFFNLQMLKMIYFSFVIVH